MSTFLKDGTSLRDLKIKAKDRKGGDLSLTAAQDLIAQERGYDSWQNMVENSVELSPTFDQDLALLVRDGRDNCSIALLFLEADRWETDAGGMRAMFASRDLLVGGTPGSVTYWADVVFEEGCGDHHHLRLRKTTVAGLFEAACDKLVHDHDPAPLLRILNGAGFFDEIGKVPVAEVEFEAELTTILRDQGRAVLDRVLLNVGRRAPDAIQLDPDRRCFFNLLDNGDVVASNGLLSGNLRWKVIEKHDFNALKAAMFKECGADADTSGLGEAWAHQHIFGASATAA